VCFTLAAYLTFPYERVKDVVIRRVQARATPSENPPKLSIEELGPHWLNGISLSGVSYQAGGPEATEAAAAVTVDELDISVSPLALLLGRTALSVGAQIGDGELDGDYETQEGGPSSLDLTLDEVDLERLGVGALLGVPLAGLASGTIDVTLATKAAETQGEVKLVIENARIAGGKSKIKIPGMAGGLTIDVIDAGRLELTIVIKDGVATLEKFEGKGKDLDLSGSGSIRLSTPLASSRTDVTLSAKLDKGYAARSSDLTKTALELMSANPTVQRATSGDGTMRFRLTGPITSLQSAPAAAAAPRGGSRAKRGSKSDDEE
jgi:type II secretion system protein N